MSASNVYRPASIFLMATLVLSGCGRAGSQIALPSALAPARSQNDHRAHPAMCTPTLWASSLSTARVNGYLAANSAPCVSLHGSYAGLHFQQPYAVAMGGNPNYLYVADLLNERIVVFDAQGNYVKWLNTKLGNIDYNPWGVCVSPQGVVGVGNIQQGTAQGNVEFFAPTAPSGSLPTGDATGQLQRQTYCAFDSAGNFFVEDGTSSGTSHIDYLASANVGLPGQTLVDAGLGSGSTWVGMYSRINSPADDTLSVASNTPNNAAQTVQTWIVSGPPAGPLTFTPCTCSPYHFHQFPHNTGNIVDGVAPTTGGSGGFLYFADYGKGRILQGSANGGAVTTYETLHGALGVATNPGGQY